MPAERSLPSIAREAIRTGRLPNFSILRMVAEALTMSTAAFAETQTQCQAELTNQYATDTVRATGTLEQREPEHVSLGRGQHDRSIGRGPW